MRLNVCGWLSAGLVCCCLAAHAQQAELKESYYPDGTLRYKGYFIGKQPVGEVVQYYPSGQMKARLNYDGEETTAVIYSKNGEFTSSGKYLNRKKTGVWEYRKGERLLTREEYSGDKLDGTSFKYYATGGIAESKTWKEGVLSGAWKVFYDNGQLKFETSFVAGKLHGPLRAYRYGGQKSVEGVYRNNVKEGVWRYYDEAGELMRERTYKGGVSESQQEDDLQENEQIRRLENDARKIVDPANFTDEPEVYLQIIDN